MESKESARLKEINGHLKRIELVLKEQNVALKSIAMSLNGIHENIAAFKESRIIGVDISQEESNELQ